MTLYDSTYFDVEQGVNRLVPIYLQLYCATQGLDFVIVVMIV